MHGIAINDLAINILRVFAVLMWLLVMLSYKILHYEILVHKLNIFFDTPFDIVPDFAALSPETAWPVWHLPHAVKGLFTRLIVAIR